MDNVSSFSLERLSKLFVLLLFADAKNPPKRRVNLQRMSNIKLRARNFIQLCVITYFHSFFHYIRYKIYVNSELSTGKEKREF